MNFNISMKFFIYIIFFILFKYTLIDCLRLDLLSLAKLYNNIGTFHTKIYIKDTEQIVLSFKNIRIITNLLDFLELDISDEIKDGIMKNHGVLPFHYFPSKDFNVVIKKIHTNPLNTPKIIVEYVIEYYEGYKKYISKLLIEIFDEIKNVTQLKIKISDIHNIRFHDYFQILYFLKDDATGNIQKTMQTHILKIFTLLKKLSEINISIKLLNYEKDGIQPSPSNAIKTDIIKEYSMAKYLLNELFNMSRYFDNLQLYHLGEYKIITNSVYGIIGTFNEESLIKVLMLIFSAQKDKNNKMTPREYEMVRGIAQLTVCYYEYYRLHIRPYLNKSMGFLDDGIYKDVHNIIKQKIDILNDIILNDNEDINKKILFLKMILSVKYTGKAIYDCKYNNTQ
ncbi:hypothetical protein SLOPH_1070 [Spraguea lophii 42_110]|uniref:Uncharacterized protein n=1 Tax=Spraguea lophii (strain 42_110) TaxID=1358809 RepID=S7XRR9_SPRLO|nr:hypothetical protein SLOPH_1070 [Spraguea lophii 42_110]